MDDPLQPFSSSIVVQDDLVLVRCAGELDSINAPRVIDDLDRTHSEAPRCVFDLADTTYCDSNGLRLFIAAHRRFSSVTLRDPAPTVRRLLALTRLEEHLDVEQTAPA